MNHRILIDTDPGQDDAIAILTALASPEIEVLGICSVAGNVPLALTTRNVPSRSANSPGVRTCRSTPVRRRRFAVRSSPPRMSTARPVSTVPTCRRRG